MRKSELFKLAECTVKTSFTDQFFMITRNDKPLGKPLSMAEAKIIYDWLLTAVYEFNQELQDEDDEC